MGHLHAHLCETKRHTGLSTMCLELCTIIVCVVWCACLSVCVHRTYCILCVVCGVAVPSCQHAGAMVSCNGMQEAREESCAALWCCWLVVGWVGWLGELATGLLLPRCCRWPAAETRALPGRVRPGWHAQPLEPSLPAMVRSQNVLGVVKGAGGIWRGLSMSCKTAASFTVQYTRSFPSTDFLAGCWVVGIRRALHCSYSLNSRAGHTGMGVAEIRATGWLVVLPLHCLFVAVRGPTHVRMCVVRSIICQNG